MSKLAKLKRNLVLAFIGLIFSITSIFTPVNNAYAETGLETNSFNNLPTSVLTTFADPIDSSVTEDTTTPDTTVTSDTTETATETTGATEDEPESVTCTSQIGGLGWIICPTMGLLSKGIDSIYGFLEDFLVLTPVDFNNNSPVFVVWRYMRDIANVFFVIFLLIVIYSQITGFGISNYGIKRALPKLIIAAILVNLSYIVCALAVDISNIVGSNIKLFIDSITTQAIETGFFSPNVSVSFYEFFTTIAAGGAIGALAIGFAGGPLGLLLALIPVLLSGIIAVVIGLATISLRQAVIITLIAIAPLAFVTYLLPNTDKWFKKWQNTFVQMLVFYPTFSLLFGISRLASYLIISSASSMLGVILGLAVQVLPLILAISLMKMSGTVLGGISNALSAIGNKVTGNTRAALQPYRDLNQQRRVNKALQRDFNPFSAASWQALSAKQRHNISFRQEQANKTGQNLLNEQLHALRQNQRIIGYDKNNQPVYSQRRPRKTNKYFDAEAEQRETNLRNMTNELNTEIAYGNIGGYLENQGITKGKATKVGKRMGDHYLDYRTALQAKAAEDRSDERFYNSTVQKASEHYVRDEYDENNRLIHKSGDLVNAAAYDKYIVKATGSAHWKGNLNTEEGRRIAKEEEINVIGDAYSRDDAIRTQNINRFQTFMDDMPSEDIDRQYAEFLKTKNIDGMIAAQNVMARRGDYDKIATQLTTYLNDGNLKLATDASQRLALNLLGMKDAAPVLGRLGKFINMETWAYTSGKRDTAEVTMDQYVTGRVTRADGSIENRATKINLATSLEGTKLTGIDRTAYQALNVLLDTITVDSMRESHPEISDPAQLEELAIKKRMEVENAMLSQEISAIGSFPSGSEQIRAMAGHMTGTKWQNGAYVDDTINDDGTIDMVKRRTAEKTMDQYFKYLTPNGLVNMKSDIYAALEKHFEFEYARQNHPDVIVGSADYNDILNSDNAKEYAHAMLREKLKDQIAKVGKSNWNLDQMKANIYQDLNIADAVKNAQAENERIRQATRDQIKAEKRANGGTN